MQKNIILVGYRATGKTTVARALAEQLQMSWVDLDQVIVEEQHQSIADMVADKGWDFFRDLEKEKLQSIAKQPNTILATGGGAILHQDIWPTVAKNNLVIWLIAEPAIICQRLTNDETNTDQRPSLTGKGLLEEVEEVLKIRTPLYRQSSELQVDANQPVADICDWIINYLNPAPLNSSTSTIEF